MLQLHLNMSYSEVYRLPVKYRLWYVERLVKYFKDRSGSSQEIKPQQNTKGLSDYQKMLDKKFK